MKSERRDMTRKCFPRHIPCQPCFLMVFCEREKESSGMHDIRHTIAYQTDMFLDLFLNLNMEREGASSVMKIYP